MLIGTDVEGVAASARLRRRLRADLADLVDVSGPPGGSVSTARRPGTAEPETFEADLRELRRRILRRWVATVAARYALVALAIAVVPAALAALGLIGWAWAFIVPAALFVVALALRLARPPSLERVARFLDDRLGLFDVTATALQLERSGEPVDEGPAAPVFAEAAALLHAGASTWHPRSRLGPRDLVTAACIAALLAVIAVIGTQSVLSGSTKVTAVATPGRAHRKGSGLTNVSPPLVPPRAKRNGSKKGLSPQQEHRSPLGLYDFGYEGKRPLPRVESGRHSGLYTHGGRKSGQQSPQSFSPQAPGESTEAREKAEEEATQGGAKATSTQGREPAGESPETLKSLTGGSAPPTGSVSPVPNPDAGAPSSSAKSPAGAAAPSSSAGAGQRPAAGAAGGQGGGRPSGSATAGHQRASLESGERGREGGSAGGALPLRAGFAAVRSSKAATSGGPRGAQGGGGAGRSAGIAGSAFEESAAASLGYVPPDAGIAPRLDPGLFARYLNALARIEGRRW